MVKGRSCMWCSAAVDNVDHAVWECVRVRQLRDNLREELGKDWRKNWGYREYLWDRDTRTPWRLSRGSAENCCLGAANCKEAEGCRGQSVPAPAAFPALPKIPAFKPAPKPKSKSKPAPQPTSYAAAIRAASRLHKRSAPPPPGVRTLVVKGEPGKTVAAIKNELQSALNPGTMGINVLRLREGKTSVSLTLEDETSWTKVVEDRES
ncbi:hypothetical protein RUM44_007534 [Polyplax serrata]|uniref:Gag-like protein n=1 Tax=Polyplax serrata TaxID=468196 RepID=A0ABR1BA87_POLSC